MTDRIELFQNKELQINDLPTKYLEFVQDFQLKDVNIWSKFISVFDKKSDNSDNGWRGEYWGKAMRGACIAYSFTKNEELYKVIENAVKGILLKQDDSGRISSYSEEVEFNGWDLWGRKYVATGLMHFADICKDDELSNKVIESVRKHIDYIIEKIGDKSNQKDILDTSSIWGAVNSSSILEPVLDLYKRTKEKKYLIFAEYIISRGGSKSENLLQVVGEGKTLPSQWKVKKAYEIMSFFEGLLEYYKISDNEKYLNLVEKFVDLIFKNEITIIGCAGCLAEEFNGAKEKQTEQSEYPTQETCVTVTWMRVLAKLYKLTFDVKYYNIFEKSFFNALYGSINVNKLKSKKANEREKGDEFGPFPFDSYSPLYNDTRNKGIGGFKLIDKDFAYGCCACIGSIAVALVPLLSIVKDGKCVVINEYFNSKFQDDCAGFAFDIIGSYPSAGDVVIKIERSKGERELKLRIPQWCEKYSIEVKNCSVIIEKGYAVLKKSWENLEEIKIHFEYKVKKHKLNDKIAFTYGPLVLSRDSKKEDGKSIMDELTDTDSFTVKKLKPTEGEIVRFEVLMGEKSILLTDYQSCGKAWENNDDLVSVWLNCKK